MSDAVSAPAPRARWGVLMTMAIVAVTILPLSLSGAMSVQMQRGLGFGKEGLGLVFAVYFGSAAVSSTGLGRLTESLGAERALRLGGVIVALACLGIGTVVQSLGGLIAAIAVAGVGSALTRPAANLWIARAVPPHRQGLALGVNHSSALVATLVAGLAVPALALTLGWQSAYLAAAGLALTAAIAVPRAPPAFERPHVAGDQRQADLSPRLLISLAFGVAFGTAGASSLGAFTVPTLVDGGISEAAAGLVIAACSVFGLIARVGAGHQADRFQAVGLREAAAMVAVGAGAFAMMAVGDPLLLLIGVPLAFATAWGWLGLFSLSVVRLNPLAPAAASGITQAGAFVGGVAGPFSLGVVAERFSFTWAWLLAAALAVVSVGAILSVARSIGLQPVPRRRPDRR